MDFINNIYSDLFPMFMEALATTEKDKRNIRKQAELCKKHGIPYDKLVLFFKDYAEWEATH